MQVGNDFEIIIASSPEHERVVAEINYKGKFAVLVSQDHDPGQFDLETPGEGLVESLIARSVPLDGLLSAIEVARQQLQISN